MPSQRMLSDGIRAVRKIPNPRPNRLCIKTCGVKHSFILSFIFLTPVRKCLRDFEHYIFLRPPVALAKEGNCTMRACKFTVSCALRSRASANWRIRVGGPAFILSKIRTIHLITRLLNLLVDYKTVIEKIETNEDHDCFSKHKPAIFLFLFDQIFNCFRKENSPHTFEKNEPA